MTVRFVLNPAGVRELITSGSARAVVMAKAAGIASRAGDGHSVKDTTTNRARATVRTETRDARRREGENRNLTRAFGGG